MDKLKMVTPDLADEKYKKLIELFPEAVTEAKDEEGNTVRAVNADVIQQEIAKMVVKGPKERYQFIWPDKRASIRLANVPTTDTLRLEKDKSVGHDGMPDSIDTENVYIEGDNLDALKILRETYLGKVKMIYIDPPYNTGHDLIYEDDFSRDADEYAENSGQIDESGNRLVENAETNGRFHTDWLNMMYPRLKIARDFMKDDGLIFISIDDSEMANLKKICDEIFGRSNMMACLVWQKKTSPDARMDISAAHDYILIYAKNKLEHGFLLNALPYDENRKSSYKNPDNDPRGPWASIDITGQTGRAPESQFYQIVTPSGERYYPPAGRCWAMAESTFNELNDDNRIWFGKKGDSRPRLKKFLSEAEGKRPWTWWDNKFASYNQESNKDLMKLFDGNLVFDNPKPVRLLSRIISLSTQPKNHDIILDFFAGSSSTAHAMLEMNSSDNGNRQFICVQLPQPFKDTGNKYKANNVASNLGYKNICDVGEERIRRAGKKIKEETGADIDYGFRVFKVDSSNMQDVFYAASEYKQDKMDLFESKFKLDRTPEDLLIQVMLELGIPLSAKIAEDKITGKKVLSVDDGYLIACFDEGIDENTVTQIAKQHPYYAVFNIKGRENDKDRDALIANFDQIFETYSPDTRRKML